jgi:hypothetical protein
LYALGQFQRGRGSFHPVLSMQTKNRAQQGDINGCEAIKVYVWPISNLNLGSKCVHTDQRGEHRVCTEPCTSMSHLPPHGLLYEDLNVHNGDAQRTSACGRKPTLI